MEPFDISSNHRIIDVIIRAPRNIPFRDGLLFFIVVTSIDLSLLSSPRAKHAGPKGLHAESARAVTGRRCPYSGGGLSAFISRKRNKAEIEESNVQRKA